MKKYILLLLISFQGLLAQVQFEAKVSRNSLGLNERLRVDFIMNVDGDNFVQPNLQDPVSKSVNRGLMGEVLSKKYIPIFYCLCKKEIWLSNKQ